jgi:hypothetical protein
MRINQKILSIPPYISTTWKNVGSLHVEAHHSSLVLVVLLLSGTRIEIPGMDPGIIKAIFAAHASYIELEAGTRPSKIATPQDQVFSMGIPLKSDFLSTFDNLGPLLQHNPERSEDPDLPEELIQKISMLSKTLGLRDSALVPEPEPNCNCMHCQISKALRAGLIEEPIQEEEEIVTDEDLKFRTWDINKTGDKLYSVSNPLDSHEQYSVYLGDPVGCTCGNPHCEHVRAVLNS